MLSLCVWIMLIDIPPPPPPPMSECTVTLGNSSVVVMCTSTNPSVMGYLVLLRFRDEDILNVNRSQDVMSPVVFERLMNGPHHVIVFPIMGENGIIGTSVLYSEMIEVKYVLTTSPPPTITILTSLGHGVPAGNRDGTTTLIVVVLVGRSNMYTSWCSLHYN